MKMTLYHLTGSARGRTKFIDADSVSFGTGDQCGITFDRAIDVSVYPLHAELTVENGHPIIRDRSGKRALFVNGLRQMEALLQDGDLLEFGEQGPQMRFRLSPDQAADTKSWRTIVEDSQDIVVLDAAYPVSLAALPGAAHSQGHCPPRVAGCESGSGDRADRTSPPHLLAGCRRVSGTPGRRSIRTQAG